MRGGSLATALRRGPIAEEHAATLVSQVGDALAAAHRQGVVHRDIKPSNILLDEDGNGYLADFGIASGTGSIDGDGAPALTLEAPYAAPEEIDGGSVSQRTDVFSLGVVIGQMLTGGGEPPGGAPGRGLDKATAATPTCPR